MMIKTINWKIVNKFWNEKLQDEKKSMLVWQAQCAKDSSVNPSKDTSRDYWKDYQNFFFCGYSKVFKELTRKFFKSSLNDLPPLFRDRVFKNLISWF